MNPAHPKRTYKSPVPIEHAEQKALIQWSFRNANRLPGLHLLHAIPNGGGRGKAEAGRLKAEGVKAGVCDLFLPVAKGDFHGLYIEMKRQNGKPSDVRKSQLEFMNDVRMHGYRAEVCFGWEQAKDLIEEYYGVKA